jgi:tetratricopeptide (TPR) repeat protein
MRDKLMDKRSIFLPAGAQCKLFASMLLVILLAGCAGMPQERPPQEPSEDKSEQTAPSDEVRVPPAASEQVAEVDPEVMFHIMAAERLISIGEYVDALEQYLEAAALADDPELARQVSRLAGQLGEWDSALFGAERWLELQPGQQDAVQIRLLALLNTGDTARALEELETLLARHDDEQEGWRRVAVLLSAAESDELAMDVLLQLVERSGYDATDPDILHIQSVLLWQLGDADQALELALKAADRGEERKHKVWSAQLAAELDELELALDIYRSARDGDPDYVPLALAEAEVLRQLERNDEAIELLRGIPADYEALYTLGIYLADGDRQAEAGEVLEALAALDAEEHRTHHAFLVAQLAELLDRDQMALAWYERVDSGANENRALLRRAMIEGRAGRLVEARNLLRSVRLSSDDRALNEQAWLVEAELLREAGMADEAVKLLTQPLRESPNNIRLLYARGLNAVHADNLELAEQDFRRIIQIDSENAMALNALGYTLTDRTSRHQEAYRLIRRALELNPDDPPTLDSMGWVYFRLGEPKKALQYLERALEGEDNPEIAAHLIEVLWTLERFDEARELRDRAVSEWPDDEYLADTLERLGLDE